MFNDIVRVERLKLLINLLRETNADIICLQEVLFEIFAPIVMNMPEYKYIDLYPQRGYKEVVLYKNCELLFAEPIKLPSVMQRHLTAVTFSSNLKETVKEFKFNVITFHLESLDSNDVRKQQIEILNNLVNKTDLPTICCGDTNLKKDEISLSDINKNYTDVWEWKKSDNEVTSHGDRYFGTDVKERYDRIWIKNLAVSHFALLGKNPINGIWISDHDGMVCDIDVIRG
jgi:endonuclease/exonuclease/phosphatase family metal-dependent hydrolase